MDPNIRMIDLSQLTQCQAKRVSIAAQREESESIKQFRMQRSEYLAALSYWLMVLGTAVWALWGIGRIAYWW